MGARTAGFAGAECDLGAGRGPGARQRPRCGGDGAGKSARARDGVGIEFQDGCRNRVFRFRDSNRIGSGIDIQVVVVFWDGI
ncbi:hypothetical protein TIFTF001_006959 [Ficus carica]|uniref:Uncharacterized protein n=1 Tax=Ficus carica TaxID=3494 RepID=A0AA88D1D6_FICCA|nr:hypothetical protein TIFTF001_006959 [Ficus carica]